MGTKADFQPVFQKLRAILKKFEPHLAVKKDDPKTYYLDAHVIGKNKKPVFFGAVCIMKNYVSFHLMPVYGCPELLKTISPELKKRMQGKACFNFTEVDTALFQELAQLTRTGFEGFKKAGYL